MTGAADMYGRLGPVGGDPHVADLLKRTYTKLVDAEDSWRKLQHGLNSSVYTLPLHEMTKLYNHWMSSLLWQAALVFVDGVIDDAMRDEVYKSAVVYKIADALCDDAAAQTRQTKISDTVLAQHCDMPRLPNNSQTYLGVWSVCNEIIDQVDDDLVTVESLGVPPRMAAVHTSTANTIRGRVIAIRALRADWDSTTMVDNRMHFTSELLTHTGVAFTAGQRLWAPYMVGDTFKEALRKGKSIEELNLGFDPWTLTDPGMKNTAKTSELTRFWESTPHDTVPILVAQVEAALRSGAIRRRTGHAYETAPWQSQFLVIRPITLGGTAFEPCHLCAYYPTRGGVEIRRAGVVRNILELLGQT